jgi:phosphatidylglycerophosphate synthase
MLQIAGARRPVAARSTHWASALSNLFVRAGVRPNQVSVAGVIFSAGAGACLVIGGRSTGLHHVALLLAAAVLIECRLLCNLLDGMLAVEGHLGTPSGAVFNELPDRVSDAVVLICASYAVSGVGWAPALGWTAATLALLTAYARALAGSLGATQDFGGPMAKQQRMQTLAACCAMAALIPAPGAGRVALVAGLMLIVAGSAITVLRRTRNLVQELESR